MKKHSPSTSARCSRAPDVVVSARRLRPPRDPRIEQHAPSPTQDTKLGKRPRTCATKIGESPEEALQGRISARLDCQFGNVSPRILSRRTEKSRLRLFLFRGSRDDTSFLVYATRSPKIAEKILPPEISAEICSSQPSSSSINIRHQRDTLPAPSDLLFVVVDTKVKHFPSSSA
ncbi:hypothetical protein F511_30986 [Dorcoceras hygrometricum]|uniref:Uncharacterized protein n=1 Tax=Dorcoceras hygrometricum TaxID=472368 RepID=A0A2Z7CHI3_9LAMI|nr:hypothetical protein F511_30986 [Dorcoceras hygrometricum]